jgi:hypothetical protein
MKLPRANSFLTQFINNSEPKTFILILYSKDQR